MKNNIFLRGVIVAKRTFGTGTVQFKIRTKRQSYHPNDTSQFFYDYNNVNFSGNEDYIKSWVDQYDVNDHVDIDGSIIQIMKRRNDGKTETIQRLIGKNINPTKRILEEEFGYQNGTYLQNENRFVLKGIVSKVNQFGKNILGINIRTFVDEKENNISTVYFGTNNKLAEDLKVGNMVCVVGNIQSNKKVYDEDRTEYFTNFVIDGIYQEELLETRPL